MHGCLCDQDQWVGCSIEISLISALLVAVSMAHAAQRKSERMDEALLKSTNNWEKPKSTSPRPKIHRSVVSGLNGSISDMCWCCSRQVLWQTCDFGRHPTHQISLLNSKRAAVLTGTSLTRCCRQNKNLRAQWRMNTSWSLHARMPSFLFKIEYEFTWPNAFV